MKDIKTLTDEEVEQVIEKNVSKAVEGRQQSGFNFPSIAEFFGVETDNPILNYRGIFAKSETPHKLDIDPEQLSLARANQARMARLGGYLLNAMPFLKSIWGSQITKPVLRMRKGKPPDMEFQNLNRLPELTGAIVNTSPRTGFGKIVYGSDLCQIRYLSRRKSFV